jgi:hypothetical protein
MRVHHAILGLAAAPFLLLPPAAGIAGEGPGAKAPAEPVLLRDAVKRGLVAAEGVDPGTYQSVTLRLESRSREPLLLDLAGSHLRNRTGDRCQRLGLGPPISADTARPDGQGRLLVALEPGQRREMRLQTVCLDLGIPAPTGQEFYVPSDALPEPREKVLRWWMDHPATHQHAVNCAIWQFRDTVYTEPGKVEGFEKPKGLFGALHGGTAYHLRDGVLTSRDPDGIVRFLGSEIFQSLPTGQGLYAIGLGPERTPELWRFALTGENPWARVANLGRGLHLKEVLPVGSGRLALVTDEGVGILDTAAGTLRNALAFPGILDVSAVRAGEDFVTVVLRVPGAKGVAQGGEIKGQVQDVYETWKVSVTDLSVERLKRYWNVESVVAGPSGVFGLTHAGRIRVLEGDDFRNLPRTGTYARLLAVGPDVLWVRQSDGRVAAASPVSGARLHETEVTVKDSTAFSVDAATGDLAVVDGERFLRLRAKDGSVEEIAGLPEEPPAAGGR